MSQAIHLLVRAGKNRGGESPNALTTSGVFPGFTPPGAGHLEARSAARTGIASIAAL